MSYLNVIDDPYDVEKHGDYQTEFVKKHFQSKLEWDSFQKHSFQAIERGDNLLVVAPTSSGKTSVARFATLYNLIVKGVRVIYTTPIKTLSNEKFREMKEVLAPYGVVPGLLTGDKKINVDSKFLIMTAEILANSLFMTDITNNSDSKSDHRLDSEFLKTVKCVVIDEIHFISDKYRGKHWESTLILLDPSIQIIGLSATINEPENFAGWLGNLKKRPITLVKKYDRPVPLEYGLFDCKKLEILMEPDGTYNQGVYRRIEQVLLADKKSHEKNKTNQTHYRLNEFIKYAKDNDLLQTCFIIFSKKNCERFADALHVTLVEGSESALAINSLEILLGPHLKNYNTMPRYRHIKGLISKGICYHHAGISAILKEAIEQLYVQGHIKVLFATETIAIGVNMPIRTIVLTAVEKNVDGKIHPLNATEFKQLCGRAGRRGLDTKGLVVFLPLYDLPSEELIKTDLLYGPLPKIISQLDLTSHSYLKLLISRSIDQNSFFNNSLLCMQNKSIVSTYSIRLSYTIKQFDSMSKEVDEYVAKNNISKDIVLQIQTYISNNNIQNLNKDHGYGNVHIKMNKQQQKQQKLIESTIRENTELYKLLTQLDKYNKDVITESNTVDTYTNYRDGRYSQICAFLTEMEYLDEQYKPTLYGKMAGFINECNPFMLTEIFTHEDVVKLTSEEMILLLSIFTDPIQRTNKDASTLATYTISKPVRDIIQYLQSRMDQYQYLEQRLKIISGDGFWNISFDYFELAQIWCNTDLSTEDHSKILTKLEEYEEFEGAYVKNMLSINNIANNLIMLCTLTQKLDMLPMLQEIEKLIVKGFVNTDSIHVL